MSRLTQIFPGFQRANPIILLRQTLNLEFRRNYVTVQSLPFPSHLPPHLAIHRSKQCPLLHRHQSHPRVLFDLMLLPITRDRRLAVGRRPLVQDLQQGDLLPLDPNQFMSLIMTKSIRPTKPAPRLIPMAIRKPEPVYSTIVTLRMNSYWICVSPRF